MADFVTDSRAENLAPAPFWARIQTLWLLLPALITAIFALLQPLAPNDLWYHVRAGQILVESGAIPRENLMSHGVPLQTPYFYQSWLSEWVLFQTLRLGGLNGLQLLRALCLTLAFGLVTLAAFRFLRRQKVSSLGAARLASLGGIFGFLVASNNVDLRPQTFSVVLCAAWIFALLEFDASPQKRRFWGAILVALALLWANFHGAFVVALLTLFAFAVAKWWRKDAKSFWIALGFCVLATLFNPRGLELYPYLIRLSSDPIGQKYIQEWAAPSLSDWHSWLFFGALPLLLWAIFRWRWISSPILPLAFATAILAVMGLRDARSMIWFALAFAPIFGFLWAPRAEKTPESAAPIPRAAQLTNAVLLVFLLALPLPLLPAFKAGLPWPPEFRARFSPTPSRVFPGDAPLLLDRTTPVEALEWLAKNPAPGNAPRRDVFTDMVCGSFLTYAGQGVVVPFCDPRIELFGPAFWEEYVRLSAGPDDASATLQKRGFRLALLDETTQKPLISRLENAGWKRVASGGKTRLLRAP